MLAGESEDVAVIRLMLPPICKAVFPFGAVHGALSMKLAVNVFLISIVTGLADAAHFAESRGLDMVHLFAVFDAGPVASDVSRVQAAKLLARDSGRPAAISDFIKNNWLIPKPPVGRETPRRC